MAIERLFIGEGVKEMEVKKYLNNELKRAGLADISIQRTPLVTRIVLLCDRPAIVIGRKGKNVKQITQFIEEKYKIERPELEIKKVDSPNLAPKIVAYRIASALERNMNPRKVGYKALQAIMRDGAKGAEIVMSGKLIGKGGRARVLKMRAGYMKKCGRPSVNQVLHGLVTANCKPGVIGVKVSIVPPNVHFPDEITIINPLEIEVLTAEVAEVKKEEAKPEAKEMPKRAKKKEGEAGAVKERGEKPKKPRKIENTGQKEVTKAEKPAQKEAKSEDAKPEGKAPAVG